MENKKENKKENKMYNKILRITKENLYDISEVWGLKFTRPQRLVDFKAFI